VIVTHPFHPLFGQEVVVVETQDLRGWRVYYRNGKGEMVSIPLSWTTLGSDDPFVVVSQGRSDFRVTDLLQLAALVGELDRASRRR
jgi:Family of unknown function (DUF5372)